MWTALTVRPPELDKVPTTLVVSIGKGRYFMVECKGIAEKFLRRAEKFPLRRKNFRSEGEKMQQLRPKGDRKDDRKDDRIPAGKHYLTQVIS